MPKSLLVNQDWKRIYQTFASADFKSYDFENLRRVIITYIRENYPEDFTDYIESSEYMALVDVLAFIGQSLAFRIDLNSRENFIDLASRRESVLRLARMIGYDVKRNVAASGLLKVTAVSTSEPLRDSIGKNLANQNISWNDPTNQNWFEQFITIMNSAMSEGIEFGRSQNVGLVQGIKTEQYTFRNALNNIPAFSFTSNVANKSMTFEIVSTSFRHSEYIKEEPPKPRAPMSFIYRADGVGPGSHNTGFFFMFKQGKLEYIDFSVDKPLPNEKIDIANTGINNDDVWLFSLSESNVQQAQWVRVSSLVDSNLIYNNESKNVKDIFSVVTGVDDSISLLFSDGVYGNMPYGKFRTYFRVSNGLLYKITPTEMRNINISIPYINRTGESHVLRLTLGLFTSVNNAAKTESIDEIRYLAPANVYLQNRIITAEDYNIAPLTLSQNIVKAKAVNRVSSGISRNIDIVDSSGRYSSMNIFADDGYLYSTEQRHYYTLRNLQPDTLRSDIRNFINTTLSDVLKKHFVNNFYNKYYLRTFVHGYYWKAKHNDINYARGVFVDDSNNEYDQQSSIFSMLQPGTLVKFVPPNNKAFKNNKIVDYNLIDFDQTMYNWVKVVSINNNTVVFNNHVPNNAIVDKVFPGFVSNIPVYLKHDIMHDMEFGRNFGLYYDSLLHRWSKITSENVDTINDFSFEHANDTSGNNKNSAWMLLFEKQIDKYVVTVRGLHYFFGSYDQTRFYYDENDRVYNEKLDVVIRDKITVLGANPIYNESMLLKSDIDFEIHSLVKYADGYENNREVELIFSDSDYDGVIDDPDSFERIVYNQNYEDMLFFDLHVDVNGNQYHTPTNDSIKVRATDNVVIADNEINEQVFYFYEADEFKIVNTVDGIKELVITDKYKCVVGRKDLKFQYVHNANVNRRIDPSVSNIIDMYLLTRQYNDSFAKYIAGLEHKPELPTSEQLKIEHGSKLLYKKSISDEIIFHPVKYKVLFGKMSDTEYGAIIKLVKNETLPIDNNDLKVKVVATINEFFDIAHWDFGDTFYQSELITYIITKLTPDVNNVIVMPTDATKSVKSLYEINCKPHELFISGITVNDIEIVQALKDSPVR